MQLLKSKANSASAAAAKSSKSANKHVKNTSVKNASPAAFSNDATAKATEAALTRAKEVIRQGGTQAEAAAAAKEVARRILKEEQAKNGSANDSASKGSGDFKVAAATTTPKNAVPGVGRPPLAPSSKGGLLSKLRRKKKKKKKSQTIKEEEELEEAEPLPAAAATSAIEKARDEVRAKATLPESREEVESRSETPEDMRDTITPLISPRTTSRSTATTRHGAVHRNLISPSSSNHHRSSGSRLTGRSSPCASSYSIATDSSGGSSAYYFSHEDDWKDDWNMPSIYFMNHDEAISELGSGSLLKDPNIMDVLSLNNVMNAVDQVLFPVDTEKSNGSHAGKGRHGRGEKSSRASSSIGGSKAANHSNKAADEDEGGDWLCMLCTGGVGGSTQDNSICSSVFAEDDDGEYYFKSKKTAAKSQAGGDRAPSPTNSNKSVSWADSIDDLNPEQSNSHSEGSSLMNAVARGMVDDDQQGGKLQGSQASPSKSKHSKSTTFETQTTKEDTIHTKNSKSTKESTLSGNEDNVWSKSTKESTLSGNEDNNSMESVSSKMKTMFKNLGNGLAGANQCYIPKGQDAVDFTPSTADLNTPTQPQQPQQQQPQQQKQPQQQRQQRQPVKPNNADNPNWRDMVSDTVETVVASKTATTTRSSAGSIKSMPHQKHRGQVTNNQQSQHSNAAGLVFATMDRPQVGHYPNPPSPTFTSPQEHHQNTQVGPVPLSSQAAGGQYGGDSQGHYQHGTWQDQSLLPAVVEETSPTPNIIIPRFNSNLSVESMEEKQDRYAGMEQQQPTQRLEEQNNSTTINGVQRTMGQQLNNGGYNSDISNGNNAKSPAFTMLMNDSIESDLDMGDRYSEQYQQAEMMQHYPLRVDPNPSSIGYYASSGPPQQQQRQSMGGEQQPIVKFAA